MLLLVMVVVVSSRQAAYKFASTSVNHHAWDGSSTHPSITRLSVRYLPSLQTNGTRDVSLEFGFVENCQKLDHDSKSASQSVRDPHHK